jgi:Vacuolar sorting 38 and autophagy-related subunit 14
MSVIATSPSLDRNNSRLTNEALLSFNSFSPSTHSRSYQQKLRLPVPVAIEIRNVFPNPQTVPYKKWYRQEYCTNLLHNVHIEIVVNDHPFDEACPAATDRIVYRSTRGTPTLCPTWSHLQDQIPFADLSIEAYESLKVRFFTVPPEAEDPSISSKEERPLYFLELHLHPSRLCRVASINMDLLPLNCVLVRFSDHTLRVHPNQFPILDSTKLIKPNADSNYNKTLSPTGSHSQAALNANGSFFEDDVFNALDPPSLPSRTDIVQDAMMVFRDIPKSALLFPDTENGVESVEHDGTGSPRPSTAVSILENGCVEVVSDDDDIFGRHHVPDSSDHDALSQQTIEMLVHQIDRESAALQEEREQLGRSNLRLKSLRDGIHTVEVQNAQIEVAIQGEKLNAGKAQFILEAQQIRLMRELLFIYPINVHGDKHYFIRGLEIPSDCYAGTVPEEVASAAFGFLCHLTSLTSKYLGLHIRYKLHCQSSRSAIQDENGNTYPLFPGRHLDREQFEYGVQLLHRNIDCICKGRNISVPSNMHILGKVLRVYENINEGY